MTDKNFKVRNGITVENKEFVDSDLLLGTDVTVPNRSASDGTAAPANTTYVDAAIAAINSLSAILTSGNSTGGTDLIVSSGDEVQAEFAHSSNGSNVSYGAGTIDLDSFSVSSYHHAWYLISVENKANDLSQTVAVAVSYDGTQEKVVVGADSQNSAPLAVFSVGIDGTTLYLKATTEVPGVLYFQWERVAMVYNETANLTLSLELQANLFPSVASGSWTPTFTRATTAYITDFEGILRPVKSGEARFEGARRVENLAAKSGDLTNATGSWGLTTMSVTSDISDPIGGTSAYTITASGANSTWQKTGLGGISGDTSVSSIWIKRRTGSGNVYLIGINNTDTDITSVITTSWQRIAVPEAVTGSNGYFGIKIATSTDAVDIWRPQLELTTGATRYQVPSEYVSNGVESAPYHGAGVDSVKYFDTYNTITVSSNVVSEGRTISISSSNNKVAEFPVSGSNVTTTSSQSFTDLDIMAFIKLKDWTPSTYNTIVGNGNATENALFYIANATGYPELYLFASTTIAATAAPTVTDQEGIWLRIRYINDTGAGQYSAKFYTANDAPQADTDYISWTLLGTEKTGASLTPNTVSGILAIGSRGNSTIYSTGSFYRVKIYDAPQDTTGTLVLDFNPSEYSSGSTWASTTGETWTINNNAHIYQGKVDTYGPKGFFSEGSRQNIKTYSEDLSDSSWTNVRTVDTQNQGRAPDGSNTANKLVDDSSTGTNNCYVAPSLAVTSGVTWCISIFAKANELDWMWITTGNFDAGSNGDSYFDLRTGGVVGTKSANHTSSGVEDWGDGWVRCWITFSSTTDVNGYWGVGPADGDNDKQVDMDGTSSILIWGAQPEAGAFPSTYIKTTSTAVTRNADLLTYPAASNFTDASGTTYAHVIPTASQTNTRIITISAADLPLYDAGDTVAIWDGSTAALKTGVVYDGTAQIMATTWDPTEKIAYLAGSAGTPVSFNGFTAGANLGILHRVSSNDQHCYGSIRKVRIYDTALTAAQVAAIT